MLKLHVQNFCFELPNPYGLLFMSDKKNSHYDILDMIFEDKYSKKYYFLMIKDNNNLQYLEIKSKYNENNEKYEIKNFFESENDLKQFTDIIKDQTIFSGCVINKYIDNHNTDCLYLYFRKEGNCVIINLLNRKIIENIKINKYIKSILNTILDLISRSLNALSRFGK